MNEHFEKIEGLNFTKPDIDTSVMPVVAKMQSRWNERAAGYGDTIEAGEVVKELNRRIDNLLFICGLLEARLNAVAGNIEVELPDGSKIGVGDINWAVD